MGTCEYQGKTRGDRVRKQGERRAGWSRNLLSAVKTLGDEGEPRNIQQARREPQRGERGVKEEEDWLVVRKGRG